MNRIITIGREHGSGGAKIGRMVAANLDIPFYDKALLREYAIEHELGRILLESFGEKHASSLLYTLCTGAFSFGYFDAGQGNSISQKAYLTAFETIRMVAKNGPCVIVGRCADYVLRDNPNCINFFVHAPREVRISTIADRNDTDTATAAEVVDQQDRMRSSYYNYYSRKNWGQVDSYHATLDSAFLGQEGAAALIEQIALSRIPDSTPNLASVHYIDAAHS